jgi:hypothetical protein
MKPVSPSPHDIGDELAIAQQLSPALGSDDRGHYQVRG